MNIPGTQIPIDAFRDEVHRNSKEKGFWSQDNTRTVEKLVLVVSELSEAVEEYRHDRIATYTQLLPTGEHIPPKPEGAVAELADAVIRLLDLAGRMNHRVILWDGIGRTHTDFFGHMFSVMSVVLRLRESFPTEAIPMIEKFAAQYVSRNEFWELVMTKHLFNKAEEPREA